MKNLILILASAIALVLSTTGCYAHGPWRGKVIEAKTKKPIEGAAVVAVWYSETRLNPAGSSRTPLKVVETATNAEGEFYFSSKHFVDLTILREVSGPDFLVYKQGYNVFQIASISEEHPLYKNEQAIIELPKLEKREDRLKAYEWAGEFRTDDFVTRRTPLMRKFINQERKYLGFTGEED